MGEKKESEFPGIVIKNNSLSQASFKFLSYYKINVIVPSSDPKMPSSQDKMALNINRYGLRMQYLTIILVPSPARDGHTHWVMDIQPYPIQMFWVILGFS